jgi:hypothetical protein
MWALRPRLVIFTCPYPHCAPPTTVNGEAARRPPPFTQEEMSYGTMIHLSFTPSARFFATVLVANDAFAGCTFSSISSATL